MLPNIHKALREISKSSDFVQTTITVQGKLLHFSYYASLINHEQFHHDLLSFIQTTNCEIENLDDLKALIPIEEIKASSDLKQISLSLTKGSIFLQIDPHLNEGLVVNIADLQLGLRTNNDTENEYSVIGPKVGFVENIDTNMNLLRKGLVSEKLIFEEHTIGSVSKTRVAIAYLEGITNPQHVNTVRQRLLDLDFEVIFDSSFLDQIIADNSNTLFPLLISTERVDRIKYSLISGQVAILSNGSPYVLSGPTTLFDFLISPEDYYLPWILGSFFRLIRYFGVAFSILATSFYVAILTFHYTVIPKELLSPIIESRINVPFLPLLEVLFLEITIELLREAGSRLPTKVGQTLGIVGGIVLGQAAVQAALTSNILLIIVSLSALASFTTPIFKMSNTIRFLRFPLIVLASFWGGLGIMIGIMFILGHLMRLKSLGSPYLVPLFPFRYKDYSDSFIRSSFTLTSNRNKYLRPILTKRYSLQEGKDIGDDYNNE
ncbi:spore germination protein [Cohnella luojiensis]|uniref:Spore germination protein n=1 Tax=Cohnella luojiensis TaxID=652876 RepID=A0A4Y8LS91_9BACL|nr:spore germination protein [Cohnella luojiensis]TFE23079.1 spore germination protein [Cohnella luojiensis]